MTGHGETGAATEHWDLEPARAATGNGELGPARAPKNGAGDGTLENKASDMTLGAGLGDGTPGAAARKREREPPGASRVERPTAGSRAAGFGGWRRQWEAAVGTGGGCNSGAGTKWHVRH